MQVPLKGELKKLCKIAKNDPRGLNTIPPLHCFHLPHPPAGQQVLREARFSGNSYVEELLNEATLQPL